MVAKAKDTKWTRQADGSYTLGEFKIVKESGDYFARRRPWKLSHPKLDCKDSFANRFDTLAKAKDFGPKRVADLELQRRTGIKLDSEKRVVEIVRLCRLKDAREYSTAMGISNLEWIGIKVGTTREAIAAECAKAKVEELAEQLQGVNPDALVATLQANGILEEYEQRCLNQEIFQSGKATIIVETFENGYRTKLIVGFDFYESNVFDLKYAGPDKDGNAVLEGIDSLSASDRERLFEDRALAFTLPADIDDDYSPVHGELFKYTVTAADASTIDGQLFIGRHRTAAETARILANVAKIQAESAAAVA